MLQMQESRQIGFLFQRSSGNGMMGVVMANHVHQRNLSWTVSLMAAEQSLLCKDPLFLDGPYYSFLAHNWPGMFNALG